MHPPARHHGQKIDHLGYRQRPTWRLAYQNFGTHESLVTNQSVEAPPAGHGRHPLVRDPEPTRERVAGRFPAGDLLTGATDGIFRWMGSIAMDRAGNMALGYSVSDGVSTFPGVRYTGPAWRRRSPLGQMPQGEGVIVNGIGAQLSNQVISWGGFTVDERGPRGRLHGSGTSTSTTR